MDSDMTAIKCQFSKIVVPGDPAYASIAGTYAGSVAEKFGFGMSSVEDIRLCTQRVVEWTIDYSMAENESTSVEVACEVIPEGFKVAVNDRGVPFEPSMLNDADSKDLSGIFHIEGHMDEILFNNLGPGGKEIVLIKYSQQGRITDLYNTCELELHESEAFPDPVPLRDSEVTIRPMQPDEAIKVSKCVYSSYGYTYPHEHIYYPAKLAELNKNNSVFSAVAVNRHEDVVGHCALLYAKPADRIAEMGLGVVKPEYRSMGCFNRLTAFLIEKALTDQLEGVYVRAVAVHKYSQQAAARFGLRETALLLAYIPPTVNFRRVGERQSQRTTALLCFRYLTPPLQPLIYPPDSHKEMVLCLYEHLGIKSIAKPPAALDEKELDAESRIHVKVLNAMRCATITIEKYGKNIVREISRSAAELCVNKIEVINLCLDLSDPRTGPVSEKMEELGFFFSGILPLGMSKGSDALIFQYVNNVSVDYAAVQAHSDLAKKLLDYVRVRHLEAKK